MMWNRIALFLAATLLLALGVSAQEAAGPVPVDVELILMADVSGSIDTGEFLLQRRGYARALRDPQIIDAIRSGFLGRIALSYVEWSGPYLQVTIVPWMAIGEEADIAYFAGQLETQPRQLYGGGTAPGNAVLYATQALLNNRFEGKRLVIDVSGDGPNSNGASAAVARDQAVAQGITINGLPILSDIPGLERYYRENVIGGRGAFSIPAADFEDIYEAVRMKLIREIAGDPLGPSSQTAEAAPAAPSRF